MKFSEITEVCTGKIGERYYFRTIKNSFTAIYGETDVASLSAKPQCKIK